MLRRSDEQRAGRRKRLRSVEERLRYFSRDGHAGEEELEGREGDDEAEAAQGVQQHIRDVGHRRASRPSKRGVDVPRWL